jgi:hypothetical protein
MVGFTGDTQPSATGYQLDIVATATEVTSAEITVDGVTTTATVNGNTISFGDETGAQGLSLLYTGGDTGGVATTVDFNLSRGIGANMHATSNDLLDDSTGLIETAIDDLRSENTRSQEQIERLERRLAYQREQLLDSFIRMEEALARFDTISKSLQGLTDSLRGDR